MAQHNKTGTIGEDIACIFLKNKGFRIIGRNIALKFGEIDIIAIEDTLVHYIEVKTSSDMSQIRPIDNMTSKKILKFKKISEYHFNQFYKHDCFSLSLDIILIRINPLTKEASVDFYKNSNL